MASASGVLTFGMASMVATTSASFARFKVGADRLAQLLLGLVVQHHTVVVEMLKVSAPRRTVHV